MTQAKVFCDLSPPLDVKSAQMESSRCYYCYDAPCIRACPTKIDIPSFIRKIGNGNVRGAALDILSANIMGGTCARVCPVETLCQEACVRETQEEQPVLIGQLQRYATDQFFATKEQPFRRAPLTGKKIAVIGAGPAGLACAHRLSVLGNDVTVFEAREKSGGLNEYGIAPYKVVDNWAQREVDFIRGVGGIEIRHGEALGKTLTLEKLRLDYAAVFLGVGLGGHNSLGVPGEELAGVHDASQFIAQIRQAGDLAKIPVTPHVVVLGGGNTAIDISIQMKQLGAEFVTLVYRRGVEQMSATQHEQELAQKNGVLIKPWARPVKILGEKSAREVEFEYTELDAKGKLRGTGKTFAIRADQVFKAIGQTLLTEHLRAEKIEITDGKIAVSPEFETSIGGVYAGGDCIAPGEDLTVTSVAQGKAAAEAIHAKLGGKPADAWGVQNG